MRLLTDGIPNDATEVLILEKEIGEEGELMFSYHVIEVQLMHISIHYQFDVIIINYP